MKNLTQKHIGRIAKIKSDVPHRGGLNLKIVAVNEATNTCEVEVPHGGIARQHASEIASTKEA